MAKGKGKKKAGKKAHRAGKKTGSRRTKRSAAQIAQARKARQTNGLKRAKLHQAAAMLADFHGGKGPIKSGCGRPRGS